LCLVGDHASRDRFYFLTGENAGSYSCIGRVLALMELRSALSRIALNFDLAFASGETGEVFEREVKDTFTLTVRDLYVVFSKRG
jgi:hypothetical protein